MRHFLIVISFLFFIPIVSATHIMGGEITWKCQGNQYVFELAIYRDCNQTNISSTQETVRMWNNPSLSSIQMLFVGRYDISPTCKPVSGSPSPILCGNGSFTGNGPGAIERIVYRSNPITLVGTPPANGWILTYDSFSRNTGITNLVDPTNHGITIAATIFKTNTSGCVDSSPQFQENPVIIICKGESFTYNMNAYDPDHDSLVFTMGKPLDNITNNIFNPPLDPIELQYEANFTYTSPTPDASFDALNQNFSLNPQSGAISFESHTTGNFVIKVEITSYKNGDKWSTIQREFQILVQNCLPTNNAPIVTSSIPTTTAIDVIAGNNVHVDFTITDNDLLQDGQVQTVLVTASGEMFGANFISPTTGCNTTPCATLNQTAPISFSGTKTVSFDWNTSCNHLVSDGVLQNSKTYTFVLQAKDNYCQIPKFVYRTIQVNVLNPDGNSNPEIECIQVQPDNSYVLTLKNTGTLTPPFYIQDSQNNNLVTINSLTQTTATIPAGNYTSFHIAYTSNCSGGLINTPSVSPIKLVLQNPQNGTAVLQWNAPSATMTNFGDYYYIYREYPTGNWTLYDSVPKATTVYRDTISICKAFFNYQVGITHGNCSFSSNIEGDTFKDKIAPLMPEIASVSIDTLTGEAVISWTPSTASDTYGYIIYKANANNILYEIDTVYGQNNTSYTHTTSTSDGPVTYSISAFDSCFTETVPVTFQTSAKSGLHSSIFVSYTYDPCAKNVRLNWSSYKGWNGAISYVIFKETAQGWVAVDTIINSYTKLFSVANEDSTAIFIKGISLNGTVAFSNLIKIVKIASQAPSFHYTKVATVQGDAILIKHYMEVLPYMTDLVIERKKGNTFEEIGRVTINGPENEYLDTKEIDVNEASYTYRVSYLDSCGSPVNPANEVTTILTKVNQVNEASMTLNVHWSPYSIFDGDVAHYELYRSINGNYGWPAIFMGSGNQLNFEDQLDENIFMDGKVCYYVVAIEGQNIFGFTEKSESNEVCYVFDPLIYIPNAFTPGGHNPIFFPVINLAEIQHYSMVIFDRWNNVMFTSDDIKIGWDGIMNNGMKAPFGVYGYQINVLDGNGKEIRKMGHVALIRSNIE